LAAEADVKTAFEAAEAMGEWLNAAEANVKRRRKTNANFWNAKETLSKTSLARSIKDLEIFPLK
jgi:hypothetical protein